MDRFVGTSHFPLSGLKWCSVLQKENKRCYVLPSLFLLINILILSLRIGFFLLYSVCRVLPCKEVLQINMNFILLKWYMSTNVSSGESVHFLSYINEPALEFVYSWAGEWLLTLNNTLRMSEKIWKPNYRIWKTWDDDGTEQEVLHLCIFFHQTSFISGTYPPSFPEKIWKGDTAEGMSAMWDAQPGDTGSLILKHCRVSSSSKYEGKFASLRSTSVLCWHCLHRGVHHVTPHKLQF